MVVFRDLLWGYKYLQKGIYGADSRQFFQQKYSDSI